MFNRERKKDDSPETQIQITKEYHDHWRTVSKDDANKRQSVILTMKFKNIPIEPENAKFKAQHSSYESFFGYMHKQQQETLLLYEALVNQYNKEIENFGEEDKRIQDEIKKHFQGTLIEGVELGHIKDEVVNNEESKELKV